MSSENVENRASVSILITSISSIFEMAEGVIGIKARAAKPTESETVFGPSKTSKTFDG
jgi:hypothetical protein